MNTIECTITIVLILISPIILSYIVEFLRSNRTKPDKLEWADNIPIQYMSIDGVTIRYIKTGQGPTLVLCHTLRTQLDIFQKMIPELSQSFTVYAFDYPGHGWSDIPDSNYSMEFFVDAVEKILDKLEINDAILAGVSIGGSIPLVLAGKNNPRIKGVVAINPYDYPGKGPARGNLIANFFMSIIYIPILGATFMRFRLPMIEKMIFEGGVYDSSSLPKSFLKECFVVGERTGHLNGFINLIRHSKSFINAHTFYENISIPVLVIYGERDWATLEERKQTISEIPNVKTETIEQAGHFLSLEHPKLLNEKIKAFSQSVN